MSQSPRYAVVVAPSAPVPETSGGRKRTARLLEAMQRAGLTPRLLVADPLTAEHRAELAGRGWIAESHPVAHGRLAPRVRRHARRLPVSPSRALARRLPALAAQAAFVQFEEIWTMPYAVAAPRANVPTIASMHNVESAARVDPAAPGVPRSLEQARARYRVTQMASVERRVMHRCDLVLAVSDADAGVFDAMGAADTLVVPNGVDDDLLLTPDGDDEHTVLFFGQLAYEPNVRGLLWFLDAVWPLVLRDAPRATLRVAGAFAGDALVEALARTPRAELAGFVPSLEPELARARLVIAPIPFGGGTRVKVLEAMAAARPVVGTAVGVEEIGFRDGVHGYIADAPGEMAAAIARLLADRAEARRLGAAARDHARDFTWRRVIGPLEERYRAWSARPVTVS